jgi:hypothetical protein
MKCTRCGKDNPAEVHTCTAPPAIYLAEQIEAVYEAPHLPRKAAAELRRLYEELEGAAQRNRDIYGQLDKAESEIDRLSAALRLEESVSFRRQLHEVQANNEALREALEMAVRQNEHDMLMTGEELRQARAALTRAGREWEPFKYEFKRYPEACSPAEDGVCEALECRDHFRDATEKVDDTSPATDVALLRQALDVLEHSHKDSFEHEKHEAIAALRERLKT